MRWCDSPRTYNQQVTKERLTLRFLFPISGFFSPRPSSSFYGTTCHSSISHGVKEYRNGLLNSEASMKSFSSMKCFLAVKQLLTLVFLISRLTSSLAIFHGQDHPILSYHSQESLAEEQQEAKRWVLWFLVHWFWPHNLHCFPHISSHRHLKLYIPP